MAQEPGYLRKCREISEAKGQEIFATWIGEKGQEEHTYTFHDIWRYGESRGGGCLYLFGYLCMYVDR